MIPSEQIWEHQASLNLPPVCQDKPMKATIAGIEMFHKTLDEGQSGDQPLDSWLVVDFIYFLISFLVWR